jgi:hypothetical protein
MRGAVTGAAAGGILGVGQGAGSTDVARQISDELANRSLKNNPIRPQENFSGNNIFPRGSRPSETIATTTAGKR